jgi:hypothetical protein
VTKDRYAVDLPIQLNVGAAKSYMLRRQLGKLIVNSIPPNAPMVFFWVRGFPTAVSNVPPPNRIDLRGLLGMASLG